MVKLTENGLTPCQEEKLKKYPFLEHCIYNYIEGEQEIDGDMSDLGVWIRVLCDENELDPIDVLKWKYDEDFDYEEFDKHPKKHPEWDWTTQLAAEFLASGHNSAWEQVELYLESEDIHKIAGLLLPFAKKYGDVNLEEYC